MVAVSTVFLVLAVVAMRAPVNSGARLRLVPTSSSSSGGRLEIYYGSAWRPICSSYFDGHEANLSCRHLGYLRASSYGRVGQLGYARSNGNYSPVKTTCYSYYTRFDSCLNSFTSCSTSYDVAVICSDSTVTTVSTSAPTSTNSLRLVSSTTYYNSSSSGGRLEIYYYYSGRYAWRPFCNAYFNSNEANLACKQLGYSYASSYGRVGSLGYSRSTASYCIRSNCYSSSTRFASCPKSVISSCSRYNDVAINCSNSSSAGVTTGLVIFFVLIFVCCGGITLCASIAACIYHQNKKKSSRVRTINVVQTDPAPNIVTATCTTTLNAQGNNTMADAAPPYTPNTVADAAPPYTPNTVADTAPPYTPNTVADAAPPYTPNTVADAAPPYTPNPYTATMPQQEPYYPPNGGNYPAAYPAYPTYPAYWEETKASY